MSDVNGDASDITNIGSSECIYSQIAKLDNESLISLKNDFENFVNNKIYIQNVPPSTAPFKFDFIYPLNK